MMRKRRKENAKVKLERKRKQLRERMRIGNVLRGLGSNLTIKDIHRKTGLSEKNIRRIMQENPGEVTYLLLKREQDKKK